MFSPYYAAARRRGAADPSNHCAVNVALYGRRNHWAMTERGRAAVRRDARSLVIGPSALSWDGEVLTIDVDEITVPLPSRIRGRVRVYPRAVTEHIVALDTHGEHQWWPIAPCARISVDLEAPLLRWSGDAYLDSNFGRVPLERSFLRWDWSRATLRDGTAVLFDVAGRDGSSCTLALRFDPAGRIEDFAPPPAAPLPPTGWGVPRSTHADGGRATLLRTLENAPFYARSLISTQLFGEHATAVHESLSLERFDHRIVQAMLPFRMPRAWR